MTKIKNSSFVLRDSNTQSPWQVNTFREVLGSEGGTPDTSTIYDVIIIGAGITGVTTSLLLQKAGKRCLLVDGHQSGFGTTGGTSAHLNTFFDATYPEIENDFGIGAAALTAKAGKESIAFIEALIKEYQIDCDFDYKEAYLFSETEKESKQLKEILESSQRAGITVEIAAKNGVPIPFDQAILFKQQAQFHPTKYISRLLEAYLALGGKLMENTFIIKNSFDGKYHIAESETDVLKGHHIVFATHIPPGINQFNFRCAAYRSYVLGVKLKDDNYPSALIYDMQEPYHYFRTHRIDGQDYLIVGGEDHKTGHDDPEAAFKTLENYVRQYYAIASVDYRWSAQYYIPVDGLPYIGQLPKEASGVYLATGFNGNGMIFGTLSAKIISDLILKNENPYSSLFSPSRIKPVAGFSEFLKENTDAAYHFIADRLTTNEIETAHSIKAGEGLVVDYQKQKMALYKDENGHITALNPRCTHAGCIVNFNSAEKSWDCPCHGGRYDLQGRVITGPPLKSLEKINIQKSD